MLPAFCGDGLIETILLSPSYVDNIDLLLFWKRVDLRALLYDLLRSSIFTILSAFLLFNLKNYALFFILFFGEYYL